MVLPWKILPIDLSQGLSDIPVQEGYEKTYAVFWWKNIPLGHQIIRAEQLPMSAIEIGNLAAQAIAPTIGSYLLAEGWRESIAALNDQDNHQQSETESVNWASLVSLAQPLAQMEKKITKIEGKSLDNNISVIVCTRDRPEQLARCLESLQKLSPPAQEIIVVDNAPTTPTIEILVNKMPGIRYVLEAQPGLSVARNTGIRHAVGDIIAFTDDDVVVHPNWLMGLDRALANADVMAVTGLVLPAELETESQQIFEVGLGNFGWGYRPKIFDYRFFDYNRSWGVPVWRIGAGANMAFHRQVFDQFGYFDQSLGAGASGCSEDSEIWYRILAEGGICYYEPTAVVFHHHRRDLTNLQQQMYQYMRGHVTALLIQYARYYHWGNLYRLFYDLPKHYLGVLIAGIIYGFGLKQRTLLSEVLGCLAGIGFYLSHCLNR